MIAERLEALACQPFRAKFHLRPHERAFVQLRGMPVVREHARDLIVKRIGAADPVRDGRQTPYRGHVVFVAQHATATCCRSCLAKWHGIPKGAALSGEQVDYCVDVICTWVEGGMRGR